MACGFAIAPARAQHTTLQVVWMYDEQGNLDKSHLIESYAPLVKRIANQLLARLPASVQFDDMVQNGMIGLLDALDRFEDGLGAQFETYAAQRIRGAMLDGLRETDWLPRSLRRNMRRIEAAINTLEQRNGRAPSEGEVAQELDIPLAEYQHLLHEARGHQLIYLEDFGDEDGGSLLDALPDDEAFTPLALLEDADQRRNLIAAIEALPEREKHIMGLYYEQELNLREIGEVLEVSESRVCQLHAQCIARLRAALFGDGSVPKPRRGRPPKKRDPN